MKTYEQRTKAVVEKMTVLKRKRTRRISVVAAVCTCVAVLALVLLMPYNANPPSVSPYADSPYYDLIRKINLAVYEPPKYDNLLEEITDISNRFYGGLGGDKYFDAEVALPNAAPGATPDQWENGMENDSYVEVTDNQVQGVIEGDIIKRSDRHIYYLHNDGRLVIYTIDGADSKAVGSYEFAEKDGNIWFDGAEMYLSKDCKTIFVIRPSYEMTGNAKTSRICIVVLDVSDVTQITEKNRIYMSGSYLSSRMAEDDLLIMGSYYIGSDVDFSDESSFLPQIGTPGNMHSIAADDIYAPEELNSLRYTVICKLDGETLDVQSSAAFLSYSEELYVSQSTIYATRTYTEESEETVDSVKKTTSQTMTQITALNYAGDKMTNFGTVVLPGTVKDQYSMDEYQGILRVVTSTNKGVEANDGELASFKRERNVSLFCVDIATMQTVASVEGFAPEGETAESVRFDGAMGYVCTAEVVTLTDPVYFFDLSDIQNITYKDTGTIDGYSSSLVNFGNGFLLGIGFNGNRELKIEVYEETADGVTSLCSYEKAAFFSNVYKSYLIDREHQLVGLAVDDWNSGGAYLLLLFDGYELREIVYTPFSGDLSDARAFVADGWLYMLGDKLKTEKLW